MNKQTSRVKALNQYLDPYPNFGRLRNAGRVVRIRTAYNGQGWLITRHEDAQALAGDPRLSVEARNAGPELRDLLSRPGFRFFDYLPGSMIITDPPDHTRLRRMVSKEFTPRRVAALAPYIRAFVQDRTAVLPRDTPVDLIQALTTHLPAAVICRWMGLDDDDAAALRASLENNSLLPVDAEVTSKTEQGHQDVLNLLSRIVERKRQNSGDDLVSVLIGAHDKDDSLSDTELVSMLATLVGGGTDAPAQMLGSGLLLLLRHPEEMARLIDDPTLIPSAVEEMLRFESPVTLGLMRFAVEDITIGDVTIPRGDLVFVGVASANHDPDRFSDPERFDVTRRDDGHLALGHGPHYCLGAPLARLEMEIMISTLLEEYPAMRLACDPADIEWCSSALRGPVALPVLLASPRGNPGPETTD